MKVLVIGSGGREHAIIWKLVQSKKVSRIFCAPGNAGIKRFAECVNIKADDIIGLCDFAKNNNIDLTVVGAELSLSLGIIDLFRQNNLLIFGPAKAAARIETDKVYAKRLMRKYKVPTPHFAVFDSPSHSIGHAKKAQYPLVIKCGSLLAGKRVSVCENFEQAKNFIENSFKNKCDSIIMEEFLSGKNLTLSVITDGYTAIPLSACVNYKKALEKNGGLDTDGMGAYAPANLVDYKLEEKIAHKIIYPIIDALSKDDASYTGVLSANLIIDAQNEPHVIGFNSGLGDPAAQTILPLLKNDLFEIFYSTAIGGLSDDYETFKISDNYAVSVVLASGGYPGRFKKDYVIEGLEFINDDDLLLFHSDTAINEYGELVTGGGRVLSLTAVASTLHRAYDRVYEAVDLIKFKGMRYRKDIAKCLYENFLV